MHLGPAFTRQPHGFFLFDTTVFQSLLFSPFLWVVMGACFMSLLPVPGVEHLPGFDPIDCRECGI